AYVTLYPSLPVQFALLIFCFKNPAPTTIYTLSLHDALPIFLFFSSLLIAGLTSLISIVQVLVSAVQDRTGMDRVPTVLIVGGARSEEHTSELQSRENLVCRLLLEKKKTKHNAYP